MPKENEENEEHEEELDEEESESTEEDGDSEEEENEDEVDLSKLTADDVKKMRKALAKANDEAKRFRLELKNLKTQNETEDDKKVREAAEEAERKTEAKYKTRLVTSEAKAALTAAGFTGDTSRFVKMLDMEEISVDDDGELVGLDEQLDDIKEEFSDLFTVSKKRKAPKGDAGNRKKTETPKTTAEKLAASINS